ncbi:MAG: T9SS type A sorting domain-containing protein [Flavobacteriales bacterium]|jgi:hypothetical protein
MKKLYTFILASLTAASAMAQIPNPSFETWASGEPEGWTTSNPASPSVTQVNDAHEGSSAAQMVTFSSSGLNFGGTLVSDEFPVSSTQQAFRGWYKANFVGGDYLNVGVFINDAGDQPVQSGVNTVAASTNVYTQFSATMQNLSGGTPVFGVVSLIIYGPDGSFIGTNIGTSVTVDDLSWGAPVSIEEIERGNTSIESVIPNPSNGNPAMVQFTMARPGRVAIEVYDLTGKKVMDVLNQQMPTGRFRAEMNTAELSSGVYFVRMITGGEVHTMRFVN